MILSKIHAQLVNIFDLADTICPSFLCQLQNSWAQILQSYILPLFKLP